MTPTTESTTGPKVETVQKTVLDLSSFESVTLYKDVTLPEKPTTVEDALAAVGNDKAKLLDMIYSGMKDLAKETAKDQPGGFYIENEDGEKEQFSGAVADEKKKKAIDLAILNMAKSAGFDKSLPLETRKSLKEQAREVVRSTPAMLSFIAGIPLADAQKIVAARAAANEPAA